MLLLIGVILAASPGPARDLGVFDLSLGAGVDKGLGPFLSQVIGNEVRAVTGKQPLLSSDLAAMLGYERQRELIGCSESSCMAELSAALGIPRALSGSVTLVEGKYLVTLTLLDVQHAQPLARFADQAEKSSSALTEVLRRGVHQMLAAVPELVPTPRAETEVPVSAPQVRSRRTAYVVGGVAAAFAIAGGVLGSVALAQANSNQSSGALDKANAADGCYVAAAASAGVAVYLYLRAGPATVSIAPGPNGAAIVAGGKW